MSYLSAISGPQKLTAEKIKSILDPCIQPPEDPLCQSLTNFLNIPDDVSDISSNLMFVDRDDEIKKLILNMSNLYHLINDKQITEPRKFITYATAVGTAGKGKTMFAQWAYDQKDIYLDMIEEGLHTIVQECLDAGQNFQIDCGNFNGEELTRDPEKSFGKRLLYEALKYHLPE